MHNIYSCVSLPFPQPPKASRKATDFRSVPGGLWLCLPTSSTLPSHTSSVPLGPHARSPLPKGEGLAWVETPQTRPPFSGLQCLRALAQHGPAVLIPARPAADSQLHPSPQGRSAHVALAAPAGASAPWRGICFPPSVDECGRLVRQPTMEHNPFCSPLP